jgi:hypothetical protein
MESALGFCLGCKIYSPMLRRGRTRTEADGEVCIDCVRESVLSADL